MDDLNSGSEHDLEAQCEPPGDLSEAAKKVWTGIYETVQIDKAASLILTEMCRQFDRLLQAREVIAREGMLISGRYGKKQNPACGIERDASASMMRAFRLLGLDQAPPGQTGFSFGEDR